MWQIKPVLWIGIVLKLIRIRIHALSILMLIQIRILPQVKHILENHKYFFDFYSPQCQSSLFYLSLQRHTSHNFQSFGHFLEKV
jgi:hypothetical protein